jgi:HPt (histidine-containing phosphotransfer) domain-containing protein
MSDGVAIDLAALRRLRAVIGGEAADLQELIEDYLEAAPALAEKIARTAADRDVDAMRIAAHTLKSNARDFGAVRLAALCEALEKACKEGTVGDALSQAVEIRAEEDVARAALEHLDPHDI